MLHYKFKLLPHPQEQRARVLAMTSLEAPDMHMPIPLDEEDIVALHGVLSLYVASRRAVMVQPDGSQQRCLPA